MQGDWSYYRGGQFNGGRIVVMEVFILKEGEWSLVVSLMEGE